MPPTKKKTTRSAAGKKQHLRHEELVQEMHQLHEAIDDLHLEIHKLTPPTAIRKAVRSFATGLVKGVGFVVGTTLIAALLIYFVQQSLESGLVTRYAVPLPNLSMSIRLHSFSEIRMYKQKKSQRLFFCLSVVI